MGYLYGFVDPQPPLLCCQGTLLLLPINLGHSLISVLLNINITMHLLYIRCNKISKASKFMQSSYILGLGSFDHHDIIFEFIMLAYSQTGIFLGGAKGAFCSPENGFAPSELCLKWLNDKINFII